MKRFAAIAILSALAGCASSIYSNQPVDPVARQCEYEAELAIQSIANPFYAGVRKSELIGLCLRAKGR